METAGKQKTGNRCGKHCDLPGTVGLYLSAASDRHRPATWDDPGSGASVPAGRSVPHPSPCWLRGSSSSGRKNKHIEPLGFKIPEILVQCGQAHATGDGESRQIGNCRNVIGVEKKSQHLEPQITASRATASFQGTSR